MSRVDVERMIVDKPRVALRFMEAMANRLQHAEKQLEDLAFKSLPARLASLLLNMAVEKDGKLVLKGYTHQDLAEMLGTYRETTTQILNDFKADGLIRIGRKQIAIVEPQRLEQIQEE
jgi:CRP-like cAMP-binding protein